MATLGELRDALTALGVSTATGDLRGEARRLVLLRRLEDVQRVQGIAKPRAQEPQNLKPQPQQRDGVLQDLRSLSLTELRVALEARQLSTQTPGLKGDARRHALLQRLLNAESNSKTPRARELELQRSTDAGNALNSARSSSSLSSSYSAAGEFLFFDPAPDNNNSNSNNNNNSSSKSNRRDRPPLRRPARSSKLAPEPERVSEERNQLEQELVTLRDRLHHLRAARAERVAQRLRSAGFSTSLDELSAAMAALERERQRLRNAALAHELVVTTVTQPPTELVQADAVRLVETRQQQLRRQLQRVKEALSLAAQTSSAHEKDDDEVELLAAIRRLELQLARQSRAVAWGSASNLLAQEGSSTSRSTESQTEVSTDLPVLTRCQSLPAHRFHETWSGLAADERQQLHRELRAAASFRIQRDRVPFVQATASAPASSSLGVLAFMRHPPTPADRLGVKALFLEQSHRDVVEIQRVYQRALALEPSHVVLLRHYARFLHRRCGQSDAAIALLESALAIDPSDAATLAALAHLVHRSRGDLARAEELYLGVLAMRPEDPLVLGDYASLLRKRSVRAQRASESTCSSSLTHARRLLEDALRIDPVHVGNRQLLALVLEDLGDSRGAQEQFERLERQLKDRPASDDSAARVQTAFAQWLCRHGHWERAKRTFEAALARRPDDVQLQRS
ncbi:hypothetical protein P43SY_009970 [Pythium insidiosum]|uniref:SAP domain-containing protein n=1 Tax=Pythium insidiosum TaxID=114742 RepID=A0AAD5LAZ7_PYTIN|nr:hypothetical protein P43SY_009970 [Pythium insidiosum]